jgi:hypothetical protein
MERLFLLRSPTEFPELFSESLYTLDYTRQKGM